jgi:YD repeat-containing protein
MIATLAFGILLAPPRSSADPVVLEITEGLPGTQARLSWPSEPGARYRVERSPDLSPGSFRPIATIDASATTTHWRDSEPLKDRMFYRVMKPMPEVFSFEPAVFPASGGLIHVHGSGLPPGARLRFEVTGVGVFVLPLTPVSPGVWAASIPGGLPPGGEVASAFVTDSTGTVNVSAEITSTLTLEVSEDGRASDGPAGLPPAAPVPATEVAIKTKGTGADPLRLAPPRNGVAIKTKATGAEPVRLAPIATGGHGPTQQGMPGEVCLHACDLELAAPAGPPLRWIRTYRSLASVPESGHGPGWDHAFNIFIEPIPATAGSSATRLRVCDGAGQSSILHRGADGVYSAAGLFRTGEFVGGSFVLTFADQGKWTFHPFDGSPFEGKIHTITDRFGVSLTCAYDASGKLGSVSDSFGRSLTVTWDSDRISSVTDSNGRHVVFSYGEFGAGGPRVLAEVSPPVVAGEPPVSGTLVYAYADHSGPALSLVAVRDDLGVTAPREMFAYSATADPNDFSFRRLISHTTSTGSPTSLHYETLPDGATPIRGYTVFHNDPTGRVTEITCDAMHRPVRMRQLTGLAAPGTPVTSTTNRPGAPIRPSDPAHYDTTFSYNADHNPRRCTCPDGFFYSFTYGREMNPAGPPRERGNLHEMSQHSAGGETRTVRCDFLPGFGTSEAARPGNPIRGMTVKGGRNPGGDIVAQGLAARPGNPIGGLTIKAGRNPGGMVQGRLFQTSDEPGLSAGDERVSGLGGTMSESSPKIDLTPRLAASGFSLGYLDEGDVLDSDDDADEIPMSAARHKHKGWDGLIYHRSLAGRRKGWDGLIYGNHRSRKGWDGLIYGNHRRHKGWDGVIYGNPKRESGIDRGATFGAVSSGEEGGRHRPFFKSYSAAARGVTISTTHVESACDIEMPALFRKILDYGEAGDNVGLQAGFVSRLVSAHGQVWSYGYTAQGALLSCLTPIPGSGFSATHDAQGRLTSFAVLDGSTSHTLAIEIGGDGFPSRVTQDPGGLNLQTEFHYDSSGRITRVTDALGRDREFDYDALDRCIAEHSPVLGSSRVTTRHFYDGARQLARIDHDHRDAAGTPVAGNPEYSACFARDSWGRVIRIAEEERPVNLPPGEFDPASAGIENFATLDFTLDAAGRVLRCAVPAACRGATSDRATEYQYDERGFVHRVIHGGASASAPVVCETDYDLHGNPVTQTIAPPGLTPSVCATTYDGFQRPFSVVDPMGNTTYFIYGSRGEITVEVHGETTDLPGSIANTLLSRATYVAPCDAGPEIVALELPSVGMACYDLRIDPPPPPASRFAPAFHGFENRDPSMVVARFTPGSSAVAEETTVITCSPAGLPQRVTLNGDVLLDFEYDSAGRLTALSNTACRGESTLDAIGRPISSTRTDFSSAVPGLSRPFTTTFGYDSLDRLTSSSSGGNTTVCDYDSCDRPVRRVAPSGHEIHITYDGSDSVGPYSRKVGDGDLDGDGSADVLFACLDRCGERLSERNHHPAPTMATYDELGRRTRVDYPDGTYTTSAFNGRGSLVHRRWQDGSTCDHETDLNGRVTLTTRGSLPAGVATVDPVEASHDGLGRRVRLAEGTSRVLTWTYDSCGNPVFETQHGIEITRSFSHRGRASLRVAGSSTSQVEERDALGRLTAVFLATPAGAPIPPAVSTMQYLGMRVSRRDQANGVSTVHTYRADGEPALDSAFPDFSHDALVETTVTRGADLLMRERAHRNANGSLTATTCDFAHGGSTQRRARLFTLDALDRTTFYQSLLFADGGTPPAVEMETAYTLAPDGARVSATGGSSPGVYGQAGADKPMQRYSSWPRGNVIWDPNGNLSSLEGSAGFGQIAFVMDSARRVQAVVDLLGGTPRSSHQHDPLGRRFISSIDNADGLPPESTLFVFDGDVCIEERSSPDGSLRVSYLVADGKVFRCDAGSSGVFHPTGGLSSRSPGEGDKHPTPGDCDDKDERFTLFTNAAGAAVELRGSDDAGTPVFLSADGMPTGSSRSALPVRWLAPACFWDHSCRLTHLPGGSYSPDLGTRITAQQGTTTGKKEFKGHVTLLK